MVDRNELVRSRAALERRRERELPPLAARKDAAYGKVLLALEAVERARSEYRDAESALLAAEHQLEHRDATLERELRDTSDPRIGAFLDQLEDAEQAARYNPDARATPAELERFAAARRVARALRLAAVPDVAERLAALAQGLGIRPPRVVA